MNLLQINYLSNLLRFATQGAVSFAMVPLLIGFLGEVQFSIWNLAMSAACFVGMLDLGISQSSIKYFAGFKDSDSRDRARIWKSFQLLSLAIALLAVIGSILICLLDWSPYLGTSNQVTAKVLFLLFTLRWVVLGIPLGMYRNLLFAQEKIWKINLVQATGSLLNGIGSFLILNTGGGLILIAMCLLILFLVESWFFYRETKGSMSELKYVSYRNLILKDILNFSFHTSLIHLAVLLVMKMDPFLCTYFTTLELTASYLVALKLSEFLLLFIKQFVNVLSPRFARHWAHGEIVKARQLFLESLFFINIVAFSLAIPLANYSAMIFKLWASIDSPVISWVFWCLLLNTCINSTELLASNFLTMSGEEKKCSYWIVVYALFNLILSSLFAYGFGILGVALGTLCSSVLTVSWRIPKYAVNKLGINYKKLGTVLFGSILLPVSMGAIIFTGSDAAGTTVSDALFNSLLFWTVTGAILFFKSLSPTDKISGTKFGVCHGK